MRCFPHGGSQSRLRGSTGQSPPGAPDKSDGRLAAADSSGGGNDTWPSRQGHARRDQRCSQLGRLDLSSSGCGAVESVITVSWAHHWAAIRVEAIQPVLMPKVR